MTASVFDRRRALLGAAGALAARNLRAQQAEPFRIGALTPITGSGSAYGAGMQRIIRAAVDAVNAAGGAGGRRFEVFSEDSQTAPEAAVLAARKLVDVHRVDAILGTWSSGETLAVMSSVTQPANVIHMNVSGAEAITTGDSKDLVWRFSPLAYSFGLVYARLIRDLGLSRPVVMYFNNGSAEAQAQGFAKGWQDQGGRVLETIVYEGRRPSYRSELQRALSQRPDAIVLAGYAVDSVIILREWFQTGIPAKFVMPSWAADQKLVEALGPQVTEGIEVVGSVVAADGRAYANFERMHRAATGQSGAANKYAAMCWDMVNVLALAAEKAGPGATRAQVNASIRDVTNPPGTAVASFEEGRDALRAGAKINYDGASSRVDFDQNGDDSGSVFAWQRIIGGRFQDVRSVSIA